jgi:hypothetical protein
MCQRQIVDFGDIVVACLEKDARPIERLDRPDASVVGDGDDASG